MHSVVQPPWDEVVKQFWVYHLSVIGIDGPEHRNNKNPDRKGQHSQRPVPERDELPKLSLLFLIPAVSGQESGEVSQHTDAEEDSLDDLRGDNHPTWSARATETQVPEHTDGSSQVLLQRHAHLPAAILPAMMGVN